jgi:alanyl-tRNA synthetase
MQETLATHEAVRLVAEAPVVNGVRIIVRALDGWDAAGLKAIASAAAAADRVAAALFSTASPVVAVIARARDVPVDAQSVLKTLVSEFGGRGGGKPDLAQGGGLEGDVSRIINAARAALDRQIST